MSPRPTDDSVRPPPRHYTYDYDYDHQGHHNHHHHHHPPTQPQPQHQPPAMSARSPLSPKVEPLAIPSQASRRPQAGRQLSSGSPGGLRLPSLPRFHPANFASQNSSTNATPMTNPNSPQAPMSPQRQYHAQMQFQIYQSSLKPRGPNAKPTSPRLIPLGSPGPVTPLELGEDASDSYLTAGITANDAASHVDKLIREEARRRGDLSPARATPVGGR